MNGIGGQRAGLSPRVRGNHRADTGGMRGGGSIPACAGEPAARHVGTGQAMVYPRVCGGTASTETMRRDNEGLSPRVRGNLLCRGRYDVRCGSIPACAGEPRCLISRRRR